MHNSPPGADEQRNNSLQRRKRQAIPLRQQEKPYYSDEHPEIPKIRRASRHLDPSALRQQTGVEEDEQAGIHERVRHTGRTPRLRPPQRETNKIPVAQHPLNRVYTPPPPAHHRPRARQRRSFIKISAAVAVQFQQVYNSLVTHMSWSSHPPTQIILRHLSSQPRHTCLTLIQVQRSTPITLLCICP